jgi:hypothetical protein
MTVDTTMEKPPSDEEQAYTYQALDASRQQIRLIKLHNNDLDNALAPNIRCELTTHDLDTAPVYIALSYVWGPPQPTQTIYLDGKAFTVRQNLYEFLHTFRTQHSNDCLIWIDQISIDQGSIRERNHQVQLMSTIYTRCKFVIAWLGLSSQGVAEEFLHDPCYNTANELLLNLYFTRVWIVQEILLPHDVRIMCGIAWVDWDLLCRAVIRLDSNERHCVLTREWLFIGRYHAERSWTLQRCIRQFAQMDCQVPHDKVYGLLGLLAANERPQVDYDKLLADVYMDVINMIETLALDLPYIERAKWFPPELDESRIGIYTQFALDLGIEEGLQSQLEDYFWQISKLDTGIQGPRKVQMGFERAGFGAGTPDCWWYEYEGQRHHWNCKPLKQKHENSSLLSIT